MIVLWHLPLYWFIQWIIHPQKESRRSLKVTSISWPLLINLNHKKTLGTGDTDYNGGQRGRGRGNYRGSHGRGNVSNTSNQYDHQDRGASHGQGQWGLS